MVLQRAVRRVLHVEQHRAELHLAGDDLAREGLLLAEEARDQRAVAIHVDEERVVPLQRVELVELDLAARRLEPLGQLALLVDREQEVCFHADDHRALHAHLREPRLDGRAVLGNVELGLEALGISGAERRRSTSC